MRDHVNARGGHQQEQFQVHFEAVLFLCIHPAAVSSTERHSRLSALAPQVLHCQAKHDHVQRLRKYHWHVQVRDLHPEFCTRNTRYMVNNINFILSRKYLLSVSAFWFISKFIIFSLHQT